MRQVEPKVKGTKYYRCLTAQTLLILLLTGIADSLATSCYDAVHSSFRWGYGVGHLSRDNLSIRLV